MEAFRRESESKSERQRDEREGGKTVSGRCSSRLAFETVEARMTLNSCCLHFPSAGMIGIHYVVLRIQPRDFSTLGKHSQPTELFPTHHNEVIIQ